MKLLYAYTIDNQRNRTHYGVDNDEWNRSCAPFTEKARSFIGNAAAHGFEVFLMDDGRLFLVQPSRYGAHDVPYSLWVSPGSDECGWGVNRGTDEEVGALYKTTLRQPDERLFDLGEPRP